MSDAGRDFWKAAILTLVLTGLGFLVGGWVLGAKSGIKVSGGEAPAEWQEKANDFRKKAWELLAERYPALLTTYRDACNATIEKLREPRRVEVPDSPDRDGLSGLEKALALASFERDGPATEVEITLDGLAELPTHLLNS